MFCVDNWFVVYVVGIGVVVWWCVDDGVIFLVGSVVDG